MYSSHFSSCDTFDRPIILNGFNTFSTFFLTLLLLVFCFDFELNDKLYFFCQNFQLLLFLAIILTVFCSRDFLVAKNIIKYEYDLFLFFVVFSSICLCFANEFLMIYLAIELQSLTLYIFAAFNRNSEFSTEAGLKYFVFGGLMSCFLLLGLSLIYLFFGSISFELITCLIHSNEPVYFCGFFFVLIVFLFKIGAAPFSY
jgi:NADH-quinone oxidoreductase subunit N